jgi:hypothetical protein
MTVRILLVLNKERRELQSYEIDVASAGRDVDAKGDQR